MTLQISDFTRQVVLDGVSDALIQKLRLFRAVKITVEIGDLVQHLDIAAGRRRPFDEGHQRTGMTRRRLRSSKKRPARSKLQTCR